ncbi:hypothetical protein V2J09_023611, partial [Rumex salicifolius]
INKDVNEGNTERRSTQIHLLLSFLFPPNFSGDYVTFRRHPNSSFFLCNLDHTGIRQSHNHKGQMGHLSTMFNGLTRSFSTKKGKIKINSGHECGTVHGGREAVEDMLKEATKNDLILRSSGFLNVDGSTNFASVHTKRGQKGISQDCCVVWEEFGCQEDMIFCGIFDGHGPWGHYVAKRVSESMPSTLLQAWQETVGQAASFDLDHLVNLDVDSDDHKLIQWFNVWKHSYLKTCAAVDHELQHHRKIDAFYSGTTALSEAKRIVQCNGRVFSLCDEPGVHRMWLPKEHSPGLAMSRSLGDYCVKEYGLISEPDVTLRSISNKDQFLIVATDGVWDVVSNQEAVQIVASTRDRAKAAERLVKCAAQAWRRKRRGIAMDDISAICLFFHSSCMSSFSSPSPS